MRCRGPSSSLSATCALSPTSRSLSTPAELRPRDRLRLRQHRARRHAAPAVAPPRGRRPVARRPSPTLTYFHHPEPRCAPDPQVKVSVNDGRQHLQRIAAATYVPVTLEPSPIAACRVAALLLARVRPARARPRFRPGGFVEPMAARRPAADRGHPRAGPRLRRRVPRPASPLRRRGGAPPRGHDGARGSRRSRRPGPGRARSARGRRRPCPPRPRPPRETIGCFVADGATFRDATAASLPATDDRSLQEDEPGRAVEWLDRRAGVVVRPGCAARRGCVRRRSHPGRPVPSR